MIFLLNGFPSAHEMPLHGFIPRRNLLPSEASVVFRMTLQMIFFCGQAESPSHNGLLLSHFFGLWLRFQGGTDRELLIASSKQIKKHRFQTAFSDSVASESPLEHKWKCNRRFVLDHLQICCSAPTRHLIDQLGPNGHSILLEVGG